MEATMKRNLQPNFTENPVIDCSGSPIIGLDVAKRNFWAEVDALQADELNRMNADERERAIQDLHCVPKFIPGESSDSIQEAMTEVQTILKKMDPLRKVAFDEACSQDPRLPTETCFMLRFLRAALYDPDDCAKRVVSYFEQKKVLFGVEKLSKHLTICDLDEEDRKCLESGIMQILPAQDRAGRSVLFWNISLRGTFSTISRQRVQFYGLQAGSDSLSVQQKGMVIVSWNHGPAKMPAAELEQAFRNPAIVAMHQVRCEAFHYCVDSEDADIIRVALMYLVGTHTRIRFRCHSGSVSEVRTSLSTFGIPTHVLPVDEDATFHFRYHRAWLEKRKEEEMLSTQRAAEFAPLITSLCQAQEVPRVQNGTGPQRNFRQPIQVILGKGRLIQELPGNVIFRGIIQDKLEEYENCRMTLDKTILAMQIVADIKQDGGRFVKVDEAAPGEYVEVDDIAAKNKVAAAFQSYRRSLKKIAVSQQGCVK